MSTKKQKKTELYFTQRGEELTALWTEGKADWPEVAKLILDWENAQPPSTGEFPEGMNKWLTSLAEKLGIQVSNLWRYRKAALSVIELWGDGYDIKTLDNIPSHMRAESIELVEKISRAAPSEIVQDVIHRMHVGQINRSELRRIWQNIRHVIKDETRRIPVYLKLPKMDIQRRDKLFEELYFEALRKDFLEGDSPVLGGKGMCYKVEIISRMLVDIVAVTVDGNGDAIYQAIDIKTSVRNKRSLHGLENVYRNFDYLWIGVPDGVNDFRHVPVIVGIIQYVNGRLKIRREAVRNPMPDLSIVSRQLLPRLLPQ